GDGLVLGTAGRLVAAARIAALAMLDHLGGALERADLADARDIVGAGPELHPELEVLVRIEALRVYGELGHELSLHVGSGLDRAGFLLNLDDDEFRRFERREPDDNVHATEIDVVLRRGFLVAPNEIGIAR